MEKIDFKKQNIPFTQVANTVLNDPNLSAKSKGLYAYLYSKPDGWDFALDRITKDFKDKRRSIYTAILELEEAGYLKRQKIGSGEKRGRTIYHLFAEIDNRKEKPTDEKSKEAKRHLAKIDSISNKDIKIIKSISNKDSKAVALQGTQWNELIDSFKELNPLYEDFYKNTTERKALDYLVSKLGFEKVKGIIEHLPEITSQPYAPKISKPTELRRDLGKLIAFYKQNNNKQTKYGGLKVY